MTKFIIRVMLLCIIENERLSKMDENINNSQENFDEGYVKEPKRNYIIYTLISIVLFFALFGGYKFISSRLSRNYYMTAEVSSLSEEQFEIIREYADIDYDEIIKITFESIDRHNSISIIYSGIEEPEDFIENCILFEYGDPEQDIRTEVKIIDNEIVEYAFADKYVDIDEPSSCCLVYEFEGQYYAEYHSSEIPPEIYSIFRNSDKVYID